MKIKNEEFEKLDLFTGITKTLGTKDSLDEILKETMAVLEKNLNYKSIILYVFDFTEKLQIKAKIGIDTYKHTPSKTVDEIALLKGIAHGKCVKEYDNWEEQMELHSIFYDSSLIKSVLLVPLLSKNHLFGFITIGETTDYKFTENEFTLFEAIGQLVSYNINHFIFQENVQKQNNELKDVTKRMRHDFANDLQSIAMALELLESTDTNEEQKKYVRILEKAKVSAIEKLQELKQLKDKYEKDVDFFIGLPLE
ncbi:MAG: GAF domain-containing protein [Candidatus Heimdallarchaeota archaeon]|nr:GAF domain-containing protein [Candidatus Heimdallarchaeota archaeon]MBY8995425.1 GAF domain-containing protein [Candidatus Heimdallarchaeota archaeon]